MTTTQERYKAAVAAVKAAGVTVRVNVRAATRGSVTHEQLGTTADMADNNPRAWTYGGQGDAIAWRDGEAHSGSAYLRLVARTRDRRFVSPAAFEQTRAKAVYWYHGGPGTEAAQKVADAFRAHGFTVEWDGTAGQAVVVTLPMPEGGR
jgi:hypothetical protein